MDGEAEASSHGGIVDDVKPQPRSSNTSDETDDIGLPAETKVGKLVPVDSCFEDGSASDMSGDGSEADAVVADFERAMDRQVALRAQYEREKAAMEDEFEKERTHLETSLQEVRELVAKLKVEYAEKDARAAEQLLEFQRDKEESLAAEKWKWEDRGKHDLKEAEDRFATELRKKDEWCDWKIKEEETQRIKMKEGYVEEIESLRERLGKIQQDMERSEEALKQSMNEKKSSDANLAEMTEELSCLRHKLKDMEDTCEQKIKLETQFLTQELERHRKDSAADLEKEQGRHRSLSEVYARSQAASPDDVIRGIADGYAAMNEKMKDDFDQKIKRYEKRIHELEQCVKDAKKAQDNSLEEIHLNQMTQLQAKYQERIDNLKRENDKMVTNHEQQLADVKRKFDDETAKYEKDMAVLTNERKQMKQLLKEAKKLETELVIVKDTCGKQEARIMEQQDGLAKAVEERNTLAKQCADKREEFEMKHDDIVKKKDSEVADMHEKFEKERNQLLERNRIDRHDLVNFYEEKLKERDTTIVGLNEKLLEENKTSSQALQDEKLKLGEAKAAAEIERMQLLNEAKEEQRILEERIQQLEGQIRVLTPRKNKVKRRFSLPAFGGKFQSPRRSDEQLLEVTE